MTAKFCKKCGVETERYANGECKLCNRARAAAWNAANPERAKANTAAWIAANTDRVKAKVKISTAAWYVANTERKKATNAAWTKANRDKLNAKSAAWQKAHPEAKRIISQNRRALQRANGGTLSKGLSAKLFKLQKGLCACCSKPLGDNFHLDHIMPIKLGGPNIDSNIQLLLPRCNNSKGAQHPDDFMQSRGFLL